MNFARRSSSWQFKIITVFSMMIFAGLMVLHRNSEAVDVNFSLSPNEKTISQGEFMSVNVVLNTDEPVVSAEVYVGYKSDHLLVNSISMGSIFSGYVDNSVSGQIRITGLSSRTEAFSGTGVMFTINFIGVLNVLSTPVTLNQANVILGSNAELYEATALGGAYKVTEQTPSAPTHITAVNTGKGNEIKLQWMNPAGGFDSVNVYRSNVSGDIGPIVYSQISGQSLTDGNLIDGVEYFYTVRTFKNSGVESVNTEQSSTIPSDFAPPDMPNGLTATSDAQKNVILQWSQSTDAVFYNVEYSQNETFGFIELASVGVNTYTHMTPARDSGAVNYYQIVAEDRAGNKALPAKISFAMPIISSGNDSPLPDAPKPPNPEPEQPKPKSDQPPAPKDDGFNSQGNTDNTPGPSGTANSNRANTQSSVVTLPADVISNNDPSRPSLNRRSGQDDNDQDGLANELERILGTDPNRADSDNDGLADGLEALEYGTDPSAADNFSLNSLNKPKITNFGAKLIETPDSTPTVKGIFRPNTNIKVYALDKNAKQIFLGESSTDANGKFVLAPQIELSDGQYEFEIKAQTEDGKIYSNRGYFVKIDSKLNIPAPIIKYFNDQQMVIDQELVSADPRPEIAGITYSNSEVVATWQSLTFTSALIADSESGDFRVRPAHALENGRHRVLLYATTGGLRSKEVDLYFTVNSGKITTFDYRSANISSMSGTLKNAVTPASVLGVSAVIMFSLGLYYHWQDSKVNL
ncbi:MAG: hypothetical protein NTZ80_02200 [Patescibacteria group bacterium]|nr:hypothetical protein [Patescibacteria group bacterium]